MSCCKIPAFIGNRLYRMELAAIYSIGGISGYCACCYTGNLTILVEGNLAVDYGIAILHVDRCTLAVNHTCSSCCTIQCHFSIAIADTFDANQILVQLNFNLSAVMAYADVLVAAEVNIIAGFYIGCFGCNTVGSKIPALVSSCTYCIQLTYVYCILVVNACSYACNTAILVYSYFIVDGCGITKQGNSCAFTIGQFGCCAVQSKACTVIADGFDSSQILIQFNLNSVNTTFCILAYADILVTAEINKITGFYIGCFGCNTVGSKIPALVSSCTYCIQLTYVYCILVVNACSYACNTAILVYSYFIVDGCGITKQGNSCAFTIGQFGCKAAQGQLSIPVADGFNAFQVFVQLNAVVGYVVCILLTGSYCYIAVTAYGCAVCIYGVNMSAVFSFVGNNAYVSACFNLGMLACFGCYCMQLATVYCVGRVFGNCTCCYASNLAILVNGNLVVNLNAAICKANAACAFTCADDGLNASQLFFQRNANFITIIAYLNVSIAIKFNCSARFYIRCIAIFSFQLPTLVGISSSFTYLLQLCNVYSISIFSTCCYISNLASLSGTAYRYSTFSSFPNVTCSIIFRNNIFRTGCRIIAYHFAGSSVSYAANAQSNAAFYAYVCTIADSNCIISRNRILMTEGNNIAYVSDCVFVAHYNRIGNIVQFIVGTCHEYVMATLFLITDKPVIIADNGRIGLFGNSVGTADYCNGTALLFSENRIVTAKNSESIPP